MKRLLFGRRSRHLSLLSISGQPKRPRAADACRQNGGPTSNRPMTDACSTNVCCCGYCKSSARSSCRVAPRVLTMTHQLPSNRLVGMARSFSTAGPLPQPTMLRLGLYVSRLAVTPSGLPTTATTGTAMVTAEASPAFARGVLSRRTRLVRSDAVRGCFADELRTRRRAPMHGRGQVRGRITFVKCASRKRIRNLPTTGTHQMHRISGSVLEAMRAD